MNYYERHLGDYAKDTAHLSMIEHGAYSLLLDRYYATEAGIPADQAHRVARARTKEERDAVDAVLQEFFRLENGVWLKERCEEEIEKAQARIASARTNGGKGGRPRKNPIKTQNEPSGFPEDNPIETQQKPNGFSLGFENETGSKALQSPISNLQSKSGCAAPPTDPSDPRKQLFDLGKSILGVGSGGLISKAIAATDEATVGALLGEMALKPKADPRAYFAAATKPKERKLAI